MKSENLDKQRVAITTIVKKFVKDSKDEKLPFLAFRRFAINSQWLNNVIKEQN